jgi:tetratricopeptide (TPR) repeat protein
MKCRSRYKKNILLVSFAILILHGNDAFSLDLISQANELSGQGRHDEAITEYKRFIFFNADSDKAGTAFFKMGLAYRMMSDWHHALDAVETSIKMTNDPIVADERSLLLATTMIASRDYNLAKLELIKLIDSANTESLRQKALYFNGVASVYTFDWNATSKHFGDYYHKSDAKSRIMELNSILSKTKSSYKSTRTAEMLSIFIPGAGQAYSGNWRDGLNAFLLNGLLIGFTANAVYKKDYNDALLIFILLSSRYYTGNIYHAGKNAEKYNEALDRRTAEKVLKLVSSDEPY